MKINKPSYCGVIFRVANSRAAGHEILRRLQHRITITLLQQKTSAQLNEQY